MAMDNLGARQSDLGLKQQAIPPTEAALTILGSSPTSNRVTSRSSRGS